jgi:hypothetical protein
MDPVLEVLTEHSGQLGEIKGMVKAISDRHEELVKSQQDHHDRLTSLETDRTKVKTATSILAAAFSGITAAVSYLLSRAWLLPIFFAISCAAPSPLAVKTPASPVPTGDRWKAEDYPVPIAMDTRSSPECIVSLFFAALFWRAQGAEYLMDPIDLGVNVPEDVALPQVILLTIDEPKGASHAAETLRISKDGNIRAAVLRFRSDSCTPWHAAHELGHALGLKDSHDENSVMYFSERFRRFNVSNEERRHVKSRTPTRHSTVAGGQRHAL